MHKTSLFSVKNLSADIPAALVVFLVALPLCLGIALGSQAPLFSGLIGGIVGGIVIGALSGSHLSVSGPAAGLTAIVAAAIGKLPAYEAFIVAVVIGGVIQVLLGYLRLGIIGDYVPSSVIKGMLAAIGLILILKQFPHLVGYDEDFEGDESFFQPGEKNTFSGLFESLRHVLPWAALIGIFSLCVQIVWENYIAKIGKLFKLIPGPLIVVVIGVVLNQWAKSAFPEWSLQSDHLVSIPVSDSMNSFASFFIYPDFSFLSNKDVWTVGLTLAIVATLETLLSIEAADKLDPYKRVTPTNRELKAQGVGNIVSGMLGGLPLTSVIVRTSANVNSGAQSKMSTILHGSYLLLSVLFIPEILNLIPKSALAAILIFTGYKLAKPSLFKEFYRKGMDQFMPFVITVLAILLSDLLIGILIGCVVGLISVFRSNFKTAVFVVNDHNKYLFRLRKDVSYLNKPVIKNHLESIPDDSYVLIDAARADFIDRDVVEVIEDFIKHASLRGIRVELKRSAYKDQGFSKEVPEEVVEH